MKENIADMFKPKDVDDIIDDFFNENILVMLKGYMEYFLDTWEDEHEE